MSQDVEVLGRCKPDSLSPSIGSSRLEDAVGYFRAWGGGQARKCTRRQRSHSPGLLVMSIHNGGVVHFLPQGTAAVVCARSHPRRWGWFVSTSSNVWREDLCDPVKSTI